MAKPHIEHRPVDRRNFLRATAASATAAAAPLLSAASYAQVPGANQRMNIGFIGCGGRAQAHINLIVKLAMENQGVSPMAVCDVWDGLDEEYTHSFGGTTTQRRYTQGLYPSAVKCGLNPGDSRRVVKDYRRLLDLKDIDAVCIATPDHWHARQTLDAFAAGKDVFVEKPMTRTIAEAHAVRDASVHFNRVLCVGVQALADPVWTVAREAIATGRIGRLSHGQSGTFRNDIRGQWRFYRVVPQMNPKTIDWDLFLGHRFDVQGQPLAMPPLEQPFDPVVFAQWRCYRPFSAGPFTDLLAAPISRMLAASGFRYPSRVMAAAGLYVEEDGRSVPDLATLVVEFDEAAQFTFTAATTSAYPQEEVLRGRQGSLKFIKGGFQIIKDDPRGGGGLPARLEKEFPGGEFVAVEAPKNETEALWRQFLDAVRQRQRGMLSGPDLGAAAVTIAQLGVQSWDEGRSLAWDHERRQPMPAGAPRLSRRSA